MPASKMCPDLAYSSSTQGPLLLEEDWRLVWRAAYTKSRQEKALAEDLRRLNVTYFLPLVEREVSSGGKRRKRWLPLFPSYVFFGGATSDNLTVAKTDRVAHFVEVPPAAQGEFRQQLASLETALRTAPATVELHPRLEVGKQVTIKSGPLKGVTGSLLRVKNKRKLCLQVSALGVGVVVEISADLVDPYL